MKTAMKTARNLARKIGGDLQSNAAFKHILSIGYEFETHDLAKLSLAEDGTTLVNSTLTLASIKIDDLELIDDSSYLNATDDTNEFLFPEYVGKITDDVAFYVTNDMGSSDFTDNLEDVCNKYAPMAATAATEEPEFFEGKNDLYTFVPTKAGKTRANEYNVIFTKHLQKSCNSFSGAEWIMTYYKPNIHPNVIVHTFTQACCILTNHLSKLTKINGELRLGGGGADDIGCALFHYPKTNLYYLQTMDEPAAAFKVRNVAIIPQMTFRVNIAHVTKVVKEILRQPMLNSHNAKWIHKEYVMVENACDCARELIASAVSRKILPKLNAKNMATIDGCVFLIIYKLSMFVDEYTEVKNRQYDDYLKNYLTFCSRHSNYLIYNYLKTFLNKITNGNGNAATIVRSLFWQPEILRKHMYKTRKYRAALTAIIGQDNVDYGNPLVSFVSYFDYFENPRDPSARESTELSDDVADWLLYEHIDGFTAQFDIFEDGSVLIENRLFFAEIKQYLASIPQKMKIKKEAMYVRDLAKICKVLATVARRAGLNKTVRTCRK